jgi:hypothetical protein
MPRCQAVTNRRRMQDTAQGVEYEFIEICLCEAVGLDKVRMVNLCSAHKALAERAAIEVTVGKGQIAEFQI